MLEKSDEDLINWLDDNFKTVSEKYDEEEKNKNQVHKL